MPRPVGFQIRHRTLRNCVAAVAGITAGIGFVLSTLKNMARQRLEEV